jgi:hypothetical protein
VTSPSLAKAAKVVTRFRERDLASIATRHPFQLGSGAGDVRRPTRWLSEAK